MPDLRQQLLQLRCELLDRHEQGWIERDEEVSEIADLAVTHSRAGDETKRLDRDGEPITPVPPERKHTAFRDVACGARWRAVLVDADGFVKLLAQKRLHQNFTRHDRG